MTHSEIKSTEFAAYIGIDWADQKHDICLREAGSNRIESLQIDHKPDSISNWVSELRQRFQGRSIAIALEQKRGALLYSLMLYEFIILYPVNPHALASYREAFKTSGAKDDPVDADLLRELKLRSLVLPSSVKTLWFIRPFSLRRPPHLYEGKPSFGCVLNKNAG